MTERIRTTISITPEVLAVFKRMGEAGNMSTSRVIGEWLSDTAEGAEMIVLKMEEAKRAPMAVMREMQALVAGMAEVVDSDMEKVRALSGRRSGAAQAHQRGAREEAAPPPFSNTGVLVPTVKATSKRGGVGK